MKMYNYAILIKLVLENTVVFHKDVTYVNL